MGIYILNPLLFVSDALVNQLVTRFPPAGIRASTAVRRSTSGKRRWISP
ncbi:MAG: hypothetical protein IPK17_38940 [Chloroflexi bacterium]|nr:hypothetical protein [Chloroflexota bacterium]